MNTQNADVLIIGAGIGGLCAGAYLADKGYKILVTEALPRIGGHCSTIEQDGIKITTGVVGPGLGGPLEQLFNDLGAEYNVRQTGPPHYLINGKIVELPQKGGLKALLSAAVDDPSKIEPVLTAFSRAMNWAEPAPMMSLREWLMQFTREKAIIDLFQCMTGATAITSIDRISARGFFRFLKQHKGFKNWGVCPEGSIALPKALAGVIEKNEGQIWTSAPAVRIHSEDRLVKGATIVKNGVRQKVVAPVVISNCGPDRMLDLAGRENFDSGYLKALQKLTPALCVSVHIKSDVPLIEYDHLLVSGFRNTVGIFPLTTVCPELAPPGIHYTVIGSDPVDISTPDQARVEIDRCLEDLREIMPKFESNGEVILTGTFKGQWPAMFSTAGETFPSRTPIVNLYAVGDGFISRSGMTAMIGAATSGIDAARDIELLLKAGSPM